jgi:sulfur-carrier protein adenylyltransferase/sulfurtransferase
MAKRAPPAQQRAAAIEAVGDWLTSQLCAKPLSVSDMASWPQRDLICGWNFSNSISDQTIKLAILLDSRFPRSRPIVAWIDPPPFPSIPHVDEDGVLCALTEIDELDPTQPLGIVKNVIGRAGTIIGDGLSGKNQADFQTEFLSYWNPTATGKDVFSIIDPSGPSRKIAVWRGQKFSVLAENPKSLQSWLSKRFQNKSSESLHTHPAFLIWLNAPLLPNQYPASVQDLEAIAAIGDEQACSIFSQSIKQEARAVAVVIGSPIDGGACFGAVELVRSRSGHRTANATPDGFRKGKAPVKLLETLHGGDRLQRQRVHRADPFWIHGRDANEDITTLVPSTVVIIGCGSLGSPLARFLAQAGVGHLHLVDGEQMELANVGRHALGAGAVGQRKSTALAASLSSEFPHAKFTANPHRWQSLVRDKPEIMTRADLIISTIGSWGHEGELNDWLMSQGWPVPCLFGWSEPHALAGHAVLVGKGSGCFACGLNQYGEVLLPVTEFSKPTLLPTPACGGFFQPYGASRISAIAGMASELAIDYLCERAATGKHHITVSTESVIEAAGGTLSNLWLDVSQGKNFSEADWAPRSDCAACGGSGI